MSKRVVFDFDGVIHSYTSGWLGDDVIPDPPVPGIREEIKKLRNAGYEIVVVTTRCSSTIAELAIRRWLAKYDIVVDDVTNKKPPARCYIDDRGMRFDGNALGLFEAVDNFEPYWKEPDFRGEYEGRY